MALDNHPPQPPELGRQPPSPDSSPLDEVRRHAGDELLTCGRTLSHAWEQARDTGPPADPHLADCPYCRDAVEGLAALDTATQALREQTKPSTQNLIARVMDSVRDEVRLGSMLPLNDPTRTLQIAEHTAATVLRRAADAIPGVTAASCRLTRADQGTGVSVSITLAAGMDHPLPETADLVRRSVVDAADHALGLGVTAVDVTVIDVRHAPVSPNRADTTRSGPGGTP
ncbi:Asp23/Gls24 family envelope stress response protein [Streptomyces sp. NPDC056242]|uniref:Asp23/Gls24 family envelope stress response protein n=1 Tax=Streptomyces sp. NPDC056242 TaxID=3345760 RepID=UPI0035E157CE